MCCANARHSINVYWINPLSGFCIEGQAYTSHWPTDAEIRTVASRSKELTERDTGAHLSGGIPQHSDWFILHPKGTHSEVSPSTDPIVFSQKPDTCFLPLAASNPEANQTLGPRRSPWVWSTAPSMREALPRSLLGFRACWKHRGEGHSLALWVRGEKREAFSCSSAQRGPWENVSEWRGHLFFHSQKVPHMLPLVLLSTQGLSAFPDVSGLHWEAGSPAYMIFQFLLFYVSPNALLVWPFFSVLFDWCFSFISNLPINAIPISSFRCRTRAEFRSSSSQWFLWPCFSIGVPFLVLFGHSAASCSLPLLAFWAPRGRGGAGALAGWALMWPGPHCLCILKSCSVDPHHPLWWPLSSPLSNSTWWSFLSMTPLILKNLNIDLSNRLHPV